MNANQQLVVNTPEQGLSKLTQVSRGSKVLFRSDGYTEEVTKRRAEFLLNTVRAGTPYSVSEVDRRTWLVVIDGGN